MKNIILNLAVTLDGFIEGPNGESDWCALDNDDNTSLFFDSFLDSIDSIFYGRVSYDAWGTYQPPDEASEGQKSFGKPSTAKRSMFSRKQAGKTAIQFLCLWTCRPYMPFNRSRAKPYGSTAVAN
jgi:dihydrofolate reductase